jgi:hypothetical protein
VPITTKVLAASSKAIGNLPKPAALTRHGLPELLSGSNMKWIFLVCGSLIGAAGAFVGGIYWERQSRGQIDNEIIFWEKVFYDTGPNVAYPIVMVSGTLTSLNSESSNNTYVVRCQQQERSCDVSYVEQIGPNQIGLMGPPLSYTIKKWDQNEIVADNEEVSSVSCVKTTITIARGAKALLWVDVPINETQSQCKHTDSNVRKYTIEDSPGWKKLGFKAPH